MNRFLALALILATSAADAATVRCRDARGRFMKCPVTNPTAAGALYANGTIVRHLQDEGRFKVEWSVLSTAADPKLREIVYGLTFVDDPAGNFPADNPYWKSYVFRVNEQNLRR